MQLDIPVARAPLDRDVVPIAFVPRGLSHALSRIAARDFKVCLVLGHALRSLDTRPVVAGLAGRALRTDDLTRIVTWEQGHNAEPVLVGRNAEPRWKPFIWNRRYAAIPR